MTVPEGWKTVRLGDVAETRLGKMLDSKKDRGRLRYRYLRNLNVQWGHIDAANLLEVELDPEDLERYEVKDGDLLVCEGGDIGRAAIWRGDGRYLAYQKALHRIRSKGPLDLEYLRYLLQQMSRAGVLAQLATGTTIKHLPQQRLRDMTIPLPSLSEQRRMVEILDDHLSRLEAADRQLVAARARAGSLHRALLTAAFTGQLTGRASDTDRIEELADASDDTR